MFDIAWSSIKHRTGGFLGAFVALFFGSAVVTACGILLVSGLTSGIPPERYAAAAVMVGGEQSKHVKEDFDPVHAERATVPADLVDEVAAVPGVKSAVGERTIALSAADDRGEPVGLADPLYGHGWSSAVLGPVELRTGAAPRTDRQVVVDEEVARAGGLEVGDTVRIAVGTTPAPYEVTGVVAGLDRQASVFFTDGRAKELSPRADRLTAIGVFADPGVDAGALADRIAKAVPGTDVYTGDRIGDLEFLDVGQSRGFLVGLSAAFGGTALGVVIFVIASTLGLSVQQRRRELAMLRAVAATPRQVHKMIGSETWLVSVVGASLGTGLGFVVARWLRGAYADVGALPADFELSYNPLPALASVVLCVLGARLAGYVAARRVARIKPVEALGESLVEAPELGRGRWISGLVLIALGLVVSIVVPLLIPGELAIAGAASALMVLMIGSALIGPVLVRAVARLMGPLLTRSRVSGYLAAANSTANTRRLSGAVVPLALGAAMALLQVSILTTTQEEAKEQVADGVVAEWVLTPAGPGLSPELVQKVREIPGVTAATPVARSQVMLDYQEIDQVVTRQFGAQGLDPADLDRTLDLDVREGGLERLTGDTIALSRTAAGTTGLDVGDTAEVHLGDGTPKKLRVVAMYGKGLGFGDVTLPHDLLTRHTTDGLDAALLVAADGGSPAEVSAALDELAADTPALRVERPDDFAAVQEDAQNDQSMTNLIANAVLLLYVLIAVVNTLVMATTARSREFAMLRLIGTTARQTRRMMFMESWVVVAAALAAGALIAVPPMVGVSLAMTEQPLPYVPPLVWVAIGGFVAVLGWLSISLPTRAALRRAPVEAATTRD